MVRSCVAAAVLAASVCATTAPAGAIGLGLGLAGTVAVGPDLGACATVTGPAGSTIVGSFTAVGQVQGPGTRFGTIRYTTPFVATSSWSGCAPGAYPGATAGEAKYVLHAHSTAGDYVEVKQCVVNRGVVTCV